MRRGDEKADDEDLGSSLVSTGSGESEAGWSQQQREVHYIYRERDKESLKI